MDRFELYTKLRRLAVKLDVASVPKRGRWLGEGREREAMGLGSMVDGRIMQPIVIDAGTMWRDPR